MNRIYRLVCNHTLHVLEVASELAVRSRGGHGRPGHSSDAKRIPPTALALALSIALFSPWPARADTGATNGGAGPSAGQGSGAPIAAGTSPGGDGAYLSTSTTGTSLTLNAVVMGGAGEESGGGGWNTTTGTSYTHGV